MKILFNKEIGPGDKIDGKTLVELIIKSRKIKNVEEFLNPPHPDTISLFDFDKGYKKSFEKVEKILKEIKDNNQMIVVYTDYDADGITGGAILWETLNLLGFKAMPYVPDRKTEGYGFSMKGIDNVIELYDPALIISVDHGITKIKEIEYASKKGIRVIVTDHHLKGEKIPEKASAIFHIPVLSGSGVSFFFSKEIFLKFHKESNKVEELKYNFKYDYLALASTGTVADLVPLVGASRSVVKHGLSAYRHVKRHGIKEIIEQSGLNDKPITPYEIGFMIAPRINAIGRLGNAIDALRLLCTRTQSIAYELANKVGNVNQERQNLVQKSVEEALQMVPKKPKKIIILKTDHWHEGIIGLIASKLVEKYYRPVIILTRNDGFYKASARSIPSFHITEFLRSLKKHLVDVGGHAAAAGFTVEKDKLKDFVEAAETKADSMIKEEDLEKTITADIKMPISKITLSMAESIKTLEPFGIGNPRPIFLSVGVITGASLFGKTASHLKVYIDGEEFIAFGKAALFKEISRNEKIDITYNIEVNEWRGIKKLQRLATSL